MIFSFHIKLVSFTFLLDLAYTGVTSDTLVAKTNITSIDELTEKMESGNSCLSPKEREKVIATPQITKTEQNHHPGVKLQIASIPR